MDSQSGNRTVQAMCLPLAALSATPAAVPRLWQPLLGSAHTSELSVQPLRSWLALPAESNTVPSLRQKAGG